MPGPSFLLQGTSFKLYFYVANSFFLYLQPLVSFSTRVEGEMYWHHWGCI